MDNSKKPKRELKVKNLFSDGTDAKPVELPVVVADQPKKTEVATPSQVPSMLMVPSPLIVRPPPPPLPAKTQQPKKDLSTTTIQLNNQQPIAVTKPVPPPPPPKLVQLASPPTPVQPQQATLTQQKQALTAKSIAEVTPAQLQPADSKKSKLEELKNKYLKKPSGPINTASNLQTSPSILPPAVQSVPPVAKQQHIKIDNQTIQPTPKVPIPTRPVEILNSADSQKSVDPPLGEASSNFFNSLILQSKANTPPVPNRTTPPPPVARPEPRTDFSQIFQKKPVPPPPPVRNFAPKTVGAHRQDPFSLKGTYTTHSPPTIQAAQVEPHPNNTATHTSSFTKDVSESEGTSSNYGYQHRETTPTALHSETQKQQAYHAPAFASGMGQPQKIQWDLTLTDRSLLLGQIQSNIHLPQSTFDLINSTIDANQPSHIQAPLDFKSKNPAFSAWLESFFKAFVVDSPEIAQNNQQLVLDFINEFFSPVGATLSAAYFTTLVKLDPSMYSLYLPEMASNIHTYAEFLKGTVISSTLKATFFTAILQELRNSFRGSEYCQRAIRVFYEHPALLSQQILDPFLKQSANQLAYSALLYLLLAKVSTKQKNYPKPHIVSLNQIVKELQKQSQYETALQLLKIINETVGTIAFSNFRETRERLIAKMSGAQNKPSPATEASKGASSIFGFFGQAIDKIKANTVISKPQQSSPAAPTKPQPSASQSENSPSFYYDPIKKRYVINGQIPDDDEPEHADTQNNSGAKGPAYVPPPPSKIPNVPPPPAPPGGAVRKPGSRIPANRYVPSSGTQ